MLVGKLKVVVLKDTNEVDVRKPVPQSLGHHSGT